LAGRDRKIREQVRNRVVIAEKAGGFLQDIVKQSDMINDKVRDIASAVEEQSSTSEEINGVSPTSTTC